MKWWARIGCLLLVFIAAFLLYAIALASYYPVTMLMQNVNGSISGHVYQLDGITPISQGKINAYPSGAPFANPLIDLAQATAPAHPHLTDIAADSSYMVRNLHAANWHVWAQSPGYGSAGYPRPLKISWLHRAYKGIDIRLPALVKIRGSIYYNDGKTPYSRASMAAVAVEGGAVYRGPNFQNGSFSLEIPEGKYWLKAVDDAPLRGIKYYPNDDSFDKASPVLVERSDTPVNFIFIMDESPKEAKTSTISGYIYKADGISPVHRTMVELFRVDGKLSQRYTTTADGYYKFVVAPGNYVLSATPFDGYHNRPKFYPDARDRSTASQVTVQANENYTGINIILDPIDRQPDDPMKYTGKELGSISGNIYNRDKSQPRYGAWLEVFPLNGDRTRAVQSGSNGRYTIRDLPPGRYYLQSMMHDAITGTYRFFPDSTSMVDAVPVYVVPGQPLVGYDFFMDLFP